MEKGASEETGTLYQIAKQSYCSDFWNIFEISTSIYYTDPSTIGAGAGSVVGAIASIFLTLAGR